MPAFFCLRNCNATIENIVNTEDTGDIEDTEDITYKYKLLYLIRYKLFYGTKKKMCI